jgi:hypothetical protein
LLAAFGIGFLAGYLMYGAIFLALGSLCESIQEAQTLLGPVALVLALPMMLIAPALDNPNAPLIEMASWFPLFTPFLLLVRAPAGLDWIEIAGMGGLMLLALIVVLALAERRGPARAVFEEGLSRAPAHQRQRVALRILERAQRQFAAFHALHDLRLVRELHAAFFKSGLSRAPIARFEIERRAGAARRIALDRRVNHQPRGAGLEERHPARLEQNRQAERVPIPGDKLLRIGARQSDLSNAGNQRLRLRVHGNFLSGPDI